MVCSGFDRLLASFRSPLEDTIQQCANLIDNLSEVIFFPKELRPRILPSLKTSTLENKIWSDKQKRVYPGDDEDGDIVDLEHQATKQQRQDLDLDDGRQVKDEDEQEDDEGENVEDEDEEEEDELVDDDFSEDDDEMGGDYNAEQYFDAGDGDDDGFGDGGGEEDAY
jgi:DNA-directed RNA polymerase III subunit RPC7